MKHIILDSERHQSEVISTMRFPLIAMIVMFHLYPPEQTIATPYASYNIIATFFSAHGIARLAVPAFFLISGYFFFYHLKEWNKTVYAEKIRKRVSTLLIPYLLWNGIPILGIILVRLLIGMNSGDSLNSIKEFGDSIGWFRAFWDGGTAGGHPFDVPLWYVRDLMVCSVCTPIIYFLLKKFGIVTIFIIGCLFLTNTWIDVAGLDVRACFFFSFGAYLSINNANIVCICRKYAVIIIPLSIVLLIVTTYFFTSLGGGKIFFDNLFLLLGVGSLIGGFSLLVDYKVIRNVPFLTKSVFFVYAFHVFPLPGIMSVTAFFKKLTGNFIVETQEMTYFIQLIVAPTAVLGCCLVTYFLMRRTMPKLLSVLTGQR